MVRYTKQLSAKLRAARQVNLGSDRIRKLLKKRVGFDTSYFEISYA